MYHERVQDQDIGPEEERESEELSRYKLEQKIKEEQRVKEEQRRTLYPSRTVQNPAAQSSIVERRMTAGQPRLPPAQATRLFSQVSRNNETVSKMISREGVLDNTDIQISD